jgi:hypothetical protein
MNPWFNVAYRIELGERVLLELMTREDWREALVKYYDQSLRMS